MKQIQKRVAEGSENSRGESRVLRDLAMQVPDIAGVSKEVEEVLFKPPKQKKKICNCGHSGCAYPDRHPEDATAWWMDAETRERLS